VCVACVRPTSLLGRDDSLFAQTEPAVSHVQCGISIDEF